MGCFNSTCVVSGMPLQAGDKVRILLVTENVYANAHQACVMNDWWIPRTFPLRAEYNDYGSVENVEEGISRDIWLDTLKIDLIPKGLGDNTCHDVPVSADMPFEKFLEALWERRITVSKQGLRLSPEFAEQLQLKNDWLPTFENVQAKLQEYPRADADGAPGFAADAIDHGCVRVRWVPDTINHADSKKQVAERLGQAQKLLSTFATVVVAGSTNYYPELRVFPKTGSEDGHPWGGTDINVEPDVIQQVSYAMIREDVWQALLTLTPAPDHGEAIPLTQYRADLTEAYRDDLERRRNVADAKAALDQATDETRNALQEVFSKKHFDALEALMDYGGPPNQSCWIVRERVVGATVTQGRQWNEMVRRLVPLEQAQDFVNSVAEMAHVQMVLGALRFLWRPSTTNWPQNGIFRDHMQFFKAMTKISKACTAEQESEG